MWWIGRITGLCILFLFSYIDIQLRRVPVWLLYLSGAAAFVYQILYPERNIWLLLGGAGVGILFLIISKVTEEGMGYGDSWGILVFGIYLGLWELVEVLLTAFFILAVFSAAVLIRKRLQGRYTLPFYPFLTGGYLTVMFIEGGVL